MVQKTILSSYLKELADRFIHDIQERGLRKGEKYYTTSEAANVFKISRETARKVMQVLSERDVLVRYRRLGTFIGTTNEQPSHVYQRACMFLMPTMRPDEGQPFSCLFPSLLDLAMPNTGIQSHILPVIKDAAAVRAVVEPEIETGRIEGIVTISLMRSAYTYLYGLGIPLVLIGTQEGGAPKLPSIDMDYFESGRLLAKEITDRGHKHILVSLVYAYGGCHRFVDGILDVISARGLRPNAVTVRMFNGDVTAARADCRHLLETAENRPTAVIASSPLLGDVSATAIEDAGLCVGKDVEVVSAGGLLDVKPISPHVRTLPTYSGGDIAALTAKLLSDQREKVSIKNKNILIPVKLC